MDKQDVDPALWPLVDAFPPIDVSAETLPGFRAAMVELTVKIDPATHPDVRIETVTIPGDASAAGIRCLYFRPVTATSAGALLHVHGGGFVMASPEADVARNVELVRATSCSILSVDYRLAPEHPHPAALEDCHTALQWLAAQVKSRGVAAGRIGVIGESAGGGLAASLALMVRKRSSVPLACQVLIYPMLVPPERSVAITAQDARIGRYIWTRASNSYCWSANLGSTPTLSSEVAATLAGLAPDLSGLPPAFIAVGDLDLFVHDNLAYASRLLAAGCSVEAHVYPGAIHAFDRMVEADVSVRFTREMTGFIQRHLG
ncbi:MAG TPA: alpha/beta hydrolase [Steroidobacteraceae bacterium]|nr:alpha/beta hydrolase [Steroidobacteraceae bacterium]